MKDKILNEITNYCSEECTSSGACPEEECVLYRIEKIVEPEVKDYEVEIEEILQTVVKVKATNEVEAIEKIKQKYKNQEIVLDTEDFKDYNIHIFE